MRINIFREKKTGKNDEIGSLKAFKNEVVDLYAVSGSAFVSARLQNEFGANASLRATAKIHKHNNSRHAADYHLDDEKIIFSQKTPPKP
jgi:hypothetical protein